MQTYQQVAGQLAAELPSKSTKIYKYLFLNEKKFNFDGSARFRCGEKRQFAASIS
jgi:hypothetical protein